MQRLLLRKLVFVISGRRRLKLACRATLTSQSVEIIDTETRGIEQ